MDKRSFTIVSVSDKNGKKKGKANLGGRFISTTPAGAARKAGTQICRNSNIKGRCTLHITVKETTRGSANKEFSYQYQRIKDPVDIVRGDVEITYNYTTKIKALK